MSRGTRGPSGGAGRGPSGRAGGGPGRGTGGCRKGIVAFSLALVWATSVGMSACNPHTPNIPTSVESPHPMLTGRQPAP